MKNILVYTLLLVFVGTMCHVLFALPAQADNVGNVTEEMTGQMQAIGDQAGYQTKNEEGGLLTMVGSIINIVLTLLGVIVLVIIIYAGFLWMTAGGNPEGVTKAKQWMTNGIIGLALILAAYAIAGFVVTKLVDVTTNQ